MRAVEEPGQLIMRRAIGEPLLTLAPIGDDPHDTNHPRRMRRTVAEPTPAILDPNRRPLRPLWPQRVFDLERHPATAIGATTAEHRIVPTVVVARRRIGG